MTDAQRRKGEAKECLTNHKRAAGELYVTQLVDHFYHVGNDISHQQDCYEYDGVEAKTVPGLA